MNVRAPVALCCYGDDVTTEREVVLPDGRTVFWSTLLDIGELLRQGHVITVRSDRTIHVLPGLGEEPMWILESSPNETEAIVTFWTTSDGPTQ